MPSPAAADTQRTAARLVRFPMKRTGEHPAPSTTLVRLVGARRRRSRSRTANAVACINSMSSIGYAAGRPASHVIRHPAADRHRRCCRGLERRIARPIGLRSDRGTGGTAEQGPDQHDACEQLPHDDLQGFLLIHPMTVGPMRLAGTAPSAAGVARRLLPLHAPWQPSRFCNKWIWAPEVSAATSRPLTIEFRSGRPTAGHQNTVSAVSHRLSTTFGNARAESRWLRHHVSHGAFPAPVHPGGPLTRTSRFASSSRPPVPSCVTFRPPVPTSTRANRSAPSSRRAVMRWTIQRPSLNASPALQSCVPASAFRLRAAQA